MIIAVALLASACVQLVVHSSVSRSTRFTTIASRIVGALAHFNTAHLRVGWFGIKDVFFAGRRVFRSRNRGVQRQGEDAAIALLSLFPPNKILPALKLVLLIHSPDQQLFHLRQSPHHVSLLDLSSRGRVEPVVGLSDRHLHSHVFPREELDSAVVFQLHSVSFDHNIWQRNFGTLVGRHVIDVIVQISSIAVQQIAVEIGRSLPVVELSIRVLIRVEHQNLAVFGLRSNVVASSVVGQIPSHVVAELSCVPVCLMTSRRETEAETGLAALRIIRVQMNCSCFAAITVDS